MEWVVFALFAHAHIPYRRGLERKRPAQNNTNKTSYIPDHLTDHQLLIILFHALSHLTPNKELAKTKQKTYYKYSNVKYSK